MWTCPPSESVPGIPIEPSTQSFVAFDESALSSLYEKPDNTESCTEKCRSSEMPACSLLDPLREEPSPLGSFDLMSSRALPRATCSGSSGIGGRCSAALSRSSSCTCAIEGRLPKAVCVHLSAMSLNSFFNGTSSQFRETPISDRAACRISLCFRPANGRWPEASLKSKRPKEKTSAEVAGLTPERQSSSGACQTMVPPIGFALFVRIRPRPKSKSFALTLPSQCLSTKVLESFTSPCTSRGVCACM
mmetsp:Transcript_67209/g.218838  ORF Transcript_67209/g.218838 Transcript_67209/m.218838 type:complete len:247 (+) Transcript_67209:454-1194(+)